MNESLEKTAEFKSSLFIGYFAESEGLWHIPLGKDGIDWQLASDAWPNPQSARRVADGRCPSMAVSAYGYTVYKDWYEEENPLEDIYLDPRVFAEEVEFTDVLAEATWCAIDEGESKKANLFFRGVLNYASVRDSGGHEARKFLDLALASNDYDIIRMYVDFMNSHTVKGPKDSKEFLKDMAHGVAAVSSKRLMTEGPGLDPIQRQVLLEDIGHAWIRKSMPVSEIDWLP